MCRIYNQCFLTGRTGPPRWSPTLERTWPSSGTGPPPLSALVPAPMFFSPLEQDTVPRQQAPALGLLFPHRKHSRRYKNNHVLFTAERQAPSNQSKPNPNHATAGEASKCSGPYFTTPPRPRTPGESPLFTPGPWPWSLLSVYETEQT